MEIWLKLVFFYGIVITVETQRDVMRATLPPGNVSDGEELLRDYWSWRLMTSPEMATMAGVSKYNNRLEVFTEEAFTERKEKADEMLERLHNVMMAPLADDALTGRNLQLVYEDLTAYTNGYPWRHYGTLTPINYLEGVHRDYKYWLDSTSFTDETNYHTYISRLRALVRQINEQIDLMREAISRGVVSHRLSVEPVLAHLEQLTNLPLLSLRFYNPFDEMLQRIAANSDKAEQIRTRGASVIVNDVIPAFRKLHRFLSEDYLPHSRAHISVQSLPQGSQFYEACLRWYLSDDISPEALHQMATSLIQQNTRAFETLRSRIEFGGSTEDLLRHIHQAQRYVYRNEQHLSSAYESIVAEAIRPEKLRQILLNVELPRLNVLTMPFNGPDVQLVTGSDWYDEHALYVNLLQPLKRQKWKMKAIILAEVAPGRFYRDIFQMNHTWPDFRKMEVLPRMHSVPFQFPRHTAYKEGWILYAESLGHDIGFYSRKLDRLGQQYSQLYQATLMAVDTGIHNAGWNYDEAVNFLTRKTGCSGTKASEDITEIITFPGRATAGLFGYLKMWELRRLAEDKQGSSFDLAAFNTRLLEIGPVSLRRLDAEMKAWIDPVTETTYEVYIHSGCPSCSLYLPLLLICTVTFLGR